MQKKAKQSVDGLKAGPGGMCWTAGMGLLAWLSYAGLTCCMCLPVRHVLVSHLFPCPIWNA